MSPCTYFATPDDRPTCQLGRAPATDPCGPACPAYRPDPARPPGETWTRVMAIHRPLSTFHAGQPDQ